MVIARMASGKWQVALCHRDRIISLAEPDFHSSESGSAESLSEAVEEVKF